MKFSFAPIVNANSKVLILGTMPSEQSLKYQQYYGNKINHFWKIIFNLFKQNHTDDYIIKTKILLDNHIALWDVLFSCECIGSLDSNIKQEIPNDFATFFALYSNIKYVFFASQNAANFYKKYVKKDFNLQYYTLPSPSTANARYSLEQKIQEWQKILAYL